MSLFTPLIAALVTFFLTRLLISSKAANKVQDMPNERSLHSTPVPRIGGVGLMANIAKVVFFVDLVDIHAPDHFMIL